MDNDVHDAAWGRLAFVHLDLIHVDQDVTLLSPSRLDELAHASEGADVLGYEDTLGKELLTVCSSRLCPELHDHLLVAEGCVTQVHTSSVEELGVYHECLDCDLPHPCCVPLWIHRGVVRNESPVGDKPGCCSPAKVCGQGQGMVVREHPEPVEPLVPIDGYNRYV